MEGLEPWLKGLLAGLPPRTATVLQRYVSWSLLPRTRRRATRGRTTVSSPRYVRTQILAAHQFLMWLETNQIGLAETTQHDVDTETVFPAFHKQSNSLDYWPTVP